jgi:hypothetical protein
VGSQIPLSPPPTKDKMKKINLTRFKQPSKIERLEKRLLEAETKIQVLEQLFEEQEASVFELEEKELIKEDAFKE